MAVTISRRDFLKYSIGGMAIIAVGSKLSWLSRVTPALAATTHMLNFTITDAIKGMVTDNAGFGSTPPNVAKCYFWIYKSTSPDLMAECPGPTIVAVRGDSIHITVTNELDEPHAFYIPGIINSGPIPAKPAIADGSNVWEADIDLTSAPYGAHLYYDNLNEPVNRVMGLHGALVVMPDPNNPADRTAGHNLTPYGPLPPEHGVQRLYDYFGGASVAFPGLAWEEGDATPWSMNLAPNGHTQPGFAPLAAPGLNRVNCPPMRTYVWLDHQASPRLFAEVGNLGAGVLYDPVEFMNKFLRDTVHLNNQANIVGEDNISYLPQYFTINGQSGMMSHFNPTVTPIGRVGEPVVVHILNAGLWAHSMHLHANHMWITSVSPVNSATVNVNPNSIWVDTYRIDPMTRIDYTIPFMRPPSIGSEEGIGLPRNPRLTAYGNPVWPPIEEFDVYQPPLGTKSKNAAEQDVELGQRQSPLCYPMHDHSEPSQTSQGGNYNNGLISGIYFTGDRQGIMDFPMDEDFWMANQNIRGIDMTGLAAPPLGMGMP